MTTATPRQRGAALLLRHCAALDTAEARPSAALRLQDALGTELAGRLVAAIALRQRARLRV